MVGRRIDGTTAVRDANGTEISSRWFAQSSFATHALATARNTVVVDHSLPLEKLGPLGCGIQTGAATVLVALNVQPGETLVVFGAGAVGLAAVMAARVAGASTIIAVDLHRHRLELGAELGATHVLDGTSDDLLSQIKALTGGGVDYAIDTTGVPAVMMTALGCVRMAGTCAFVGIQTGDLVLDGLALVGKTAIGILEGSANPHTFIPRMINLWQEGRFPFDRLIQEFPPRTDQRSRACLAQRSSDQARPAPHTGLRFGVPRRVPGAELGCASCRAIPRRRDRARGSAHDERTGRSPRPRSTSGSDG